MCASRHVILLRPAFEDMTFTMVNPPMGLGYLAAELEASHYPTTIIDLALRNVTMETLLRFIVKKGPLLIGITALTCYYQGMKDLASTIKKRFPTTPVILGGVHVSALPELSLRETGADIVVIGEGERTIVELATAINEKDENFSEIPGIAYIDGTRVHLTPPRPLIPDLNSISWPAWHKIDPRKYPKDPHGFIVKHEKFAPVITTRGCPYTCHYCASCSFWNNTIRYRSAKDVADEIAYLARYFGTREIHFWDDNLTLKKKHVMAICRELLDRSIRVACTTPNGIRVDTLDEDTLKIMKNAGFYYLVFSVESGSLKTLKENGKYTSLKKIIQNFRIAKNLGFYINCFFMLGFPGESTEDARKTIRFAKSIPFHMRSFFIVKPLPGSRIFSEWSNGKELLNFNWKKINYYDASISVSTIPRERLEKLQKTAYIQTISRLPDFLTTIHVRFIKFFHFFQLRFLIQRALYLVLGFKPGISF